MRAASLALVITIAAVPATVPLAQQPSERVVIYEEDKKVREGKKHVGSVQWHVESSSPVSGLPPALAIRADIEIPERRMTVTMTLRKNTDQALSASHTVEIRINLPADFPSKGIRNIPGIMMKEREEGRGTPLAGLAVKVRENSFLMGLSAADADLKRNMELLRERDWIDLPVVYGNGARAIIAIQKGETGKAAFATRAFWSPFYRLLESDCASIGRPAIGMTRAEAERTCWGLPLRAERTTKETGVREELFYRFGRLEFQDGRLVAIQETE